jgi:LPXTG-motif cell wall-anchored protein
VETTAPPDAGGVTPPTTVAPGIETPDELPTTGSSTTPLAAAALLLLGLGLVALRVARRSTRA